MPLTQTYEKFQFTLSNGATHRTYYMSPLFKKSKKSPRESGP